MRTGFILSLLLGFPLAQPGIAQSLQPNDPLPPPSPALPSLGDPPSVPVLPDFAAAPCPEKTIASTRVLLVPHERATTVPDWKLRAVEVGRLPGGPALEFREEKRIITEMTLQARKVPQQVVCNENKPITVTDPLTGKCRTEYQVCPVVKTIMVNVYDTVPVQRVVIVRVPCLKCGPDVVIKKLVLDQLTLPAIERTFTAVTTTNQLILPACPPPPPPPPCLAPGHP